MNDIPSWAKPGDFGDMQPKKRWAILIIGFAIFLILFLLQMIETLVGASELGQLKKNGDTADGYVIKRTKEQPLLPLFGKLKLMVAYSYGVEENNAFRMLCSTQQVTEAEFLLLETNTNVHVTYLKTRPELSRIEMKLHPGSVRRMIIYSIGWIGFLYLILANATIDRRKKKAPHADLPAV